MFQLTQKEFGNLKSQNATSSWGGRRKLPYAFIEHGVLMLSSVLNSERAIKVNTQIMRIYTPRPRIGFDAKTQARLKEGRRVLGKANAKWISGGGDAGGNPDRVTDYQIIKMDWFYKKDWFLLLFLPSPAGLF